MFAIEVDSLTQVYGKRRGVEALSLAVPEGSLFGFLGPNGAGKTTTIRVLLGFLRATAGRAAVLGRDCWRDTARIKADVGYVPGDIRLYPWLDGYAALRFVSAVRGIDATGHGRELADRYSLDLRVRVRSMSRGMRQKLGLILALAHRPKVLVLDEPTSGLDPLTQQTFREHLRSLAAAGVTVFFSSHTLGEVEDLCDRVAIVRDGRLVVNESLDALRRRAGHEVTIRWTSPADAAAQPPEFLSVHTRNAQTWHAAFDEPIAVLTAWLAGRNIDDLTIARPDLETLFRRFYAAEPKR